jgi:hypothetical protein
MAAKMTSAVKAIFRFSTSPCASAVASRELMRAWREL